MSWARPKLPGEYCRACGRYPAERAWCHRMDSDKRLYALTRPRATTGPARAMWVCPGCDCWAGLDYGHVLPFPQSEEGYRITFHRIRAWFGPEYSHVARHLVDRLRERRYIERLERARFDWRRDLPRAVADWAGYELSALAANENCVDNNRVALLDSKAQVRRYRKQQAAGCCGSRDVERTFQGKKYMLGFNYGH